MVTENEMEIRDLKLENDRLKQRDELMFSLLSDITCMTDCVKCRFYNPGHPCRLNVIVPDRDKVNTLFDNIIGVITQLEDL